MIRSKKLILLIILLVLLSQTPFAYRRYKLRRLSTAIQQLNGERRAPQANGFSEYKGVVHVHSFLGGHSSGGFAEIISAAQANQLQFVVMTEHIEKDFDTAAMTLQGTHGGVLFVNGNEVSDANGDRVLKLPDNVAIAAYPEEFKNWDTPGLNGVEVYNVFTNARRINPLVAFFDVLWSQRSYPELIFALYLTRPDGSLQKWDQVSSQRRLTAVGGNDAHSNIGVSLNDSSGKRLLGVKLDPYETSFRLVRLHVLIEQNKTLDRTTLLEAIRAGHCFIGFDFLGDTSGFRFEAVNVLESKLQGDALESLNQTKLRVSVPVSSRIVIFKDGEVLVDESGLRTRELPIIDPGVYRVEVYLPQLGVSAPWIISNPIYVK